MLTHLDPEGHESVIGDSAALSLIIPAERTVYLFASFDTAWEQAAIIYLNSERYENQIGSYVLRPNELTIPPQPVEYKLTIVGWHKRGSANPNLPWLTSRGRRIGPVVFAWDDSAEDEDFRDMRIKLVTS
jgi:hypothetical protein